MLAVAAVLLSCGAGIEVQVKESLVDVTAKGAPVAAVLACLGEKTEIDIVDLDKVLPSRTADVAFRRQSPRQAIERVLVQAGLNYALQTDNSGAVVQRIVITGTKAVPASGAPDPVAVPLPMAGGEAPVAAPSPEPVATAAMPLPLPQGPGGYRDRFDGRRRGRDRFQGRTSFPGAAAPTTPPTQPVEPTGAAAPLYPEPHALTPTS